jgi:hypothetical protein
MCVVSQPTLVKVVHFLLVAVLRGWEVVGLWFMVGYREGVVD